MDLSHLIAHFADYARDRLGLVRFFPVQLLTAAPFTQFFVDGVSDEKAR